MAVKQVREYYNAISEQYVEMLDTLREMEADAENNLISSEQVDAMRATVEGIKSNYQRVSYMMYLLDTPQRKSKVEKWDKQNRKKISNLDSNNSTEACLNENKKALSELKGMFRK